MGNFSPPLSLQIRFRRPPADLSSLIPVKEWAASNGYARTSVIDMIRRRALVGYKLQGRWYVDTNFPRVEKARYP